MENVKLIVAVVNTAMKNLKNAQSVWKVALNVHLHQNVPIVRLATYKKKINVKAAIQIALLVSTMNAKNVMQTSSLMIRNYVLRTVEIHFMVINQAKNASYVEQIVMFVITQIQINVQHAGTVIMNKMVNVNRAL